MLKVLEGGVLTTVQDWPGRAGFLSLGMFPAGPQDHYAHRFANLLVGNEPGTAALEIVAGMFKAEFAEDTVVAVTGANMQPTLNGQPMPLWQSAAVSAGDTLHLSSVKGHGFSAYLAVAGGIDVPDYMGSKATFTPGQFGGFQGRGLKRGDQVPTGRPRMGLAQVANRRVKAAAIPAYSGMWEIETMRGPQADPDYLTAEDVVVFFSREWKVDRNSNRMGYRLESYRWQWARTTGGVAGGHPSNILDNGYAVGTINVCGDQPIILCVDGPSLGGFICNACIVQVGMWKIGQIVPGRDRIRFREVTIGEAVALARAMKATVSEQSIERA